MSADGIAAVVLAGTHHWNGSSFERLGPRPLLPVAGTPLIAYSLRWLGAAGVSRAAICGNGSTPVIEAALGGGAELGMELSYHRDGIPRGPAGCVRDAGLRSGAETLVVASGTSIPTVDLAELLASHRASAAAMTAVVHQERAAAASPMPGGVYVFARRALDHIAETGFQDIKEGLIPRLHRAGERVVAHRSPGACPHVVDPRTYLAVNEWALQRIPVEDLLHPTAQVDPGALLVGPVWLGAGARVEAGATVVGPTSIGADATVGRNAVVARSALWSRAAVGEGSVVHGCVAGDGAVVAPGSRLFNLVLDPPRPPLGERGLSWWGQARTLAAAAPPPQLAGSMPPSCTLG